MTTLSAAYGCDHCDKPLIEGPELCVTVSSIDGVRHHVHLDCLPEYARDLARRSWPPLVTS